MIVCIFLIGFFATSVWAQTLVLQITQNIDGCRGGEICDTQPSIVILNQASLQIEYGFSGNVYVQLGSTPTGYESLYIGQDCDLSGCGQKVIGSLASVAFSNGVAEFENLNIKDAGTGYTLHFVARKSSGELLTDVYGDVFDVSVGVPYKLAFTTHVGTAIGGQEFRNSPAVAVVDRGGNIVTDASSYIDLDGSDTDTVQAVLTTCPYSSLCPSAQDTAALLQPPARTSVQMNGGIASFGGLFLNVSGYPYQITFYASMSILASSSVESDFFAVSTGTAAKLAFVDGYNLAFTTKYSGEFFTVPPRLRLLDRGGNFVSTDNSSALMVSIRHNPTGTAKIGPVENTFVVANQGIVSFNAVRVDTPGHNYTLEFTLFLYSSQAQGHISSGASLVSEKFEVFYGPTRKLVFAPLSNVPTGTSAVGDPSASLISPVPGAVSVVGVAAGAWAGNQAFKQQPVLQLQDYGGSARIPDSSAAVTASIVPSLSVGADGDILVDTTGAEQIYVSNISIALADGYYGVGQVIDVIVSFTANVWVVEENTTTLANATAPVEMPYLSLNLSQSVEALPAHAVLTGRLLQARMLTFRYVVQKGDSSYNSPLDLTSSLALFLNSTAIVDGSGSAVNTTLPYPYVSVAQSVVIDTSSPVATLLSTNTTDGEYGEGQAIEFSVTFDRPVVVKGFPYLLLNAANFSGNTSSNASSTPAVAIFSHISDEDTVVHFVYVVREFDSTASAELALADAAIQVWNATSNTTLVSYIDAFLVQYNASAANATVNGSDYNVSGHYHYDYMYSNVVAGAILRKSDTPTTLASYNLTTVSDTFSNEHSIVIDTDAPALDSSYGVRTTHSDGTYYPGEYIYLTIRFDKPIEVFGVGIHLVMNAGPHSLSSSTDYQGLAYVTDLRPDNVTLQFVYIVEQYTNTSALDVASGELSLGVPADTAWIRRASTHPKTDADVNTTALHSSSTSLGATAALEVIGYAPTVLSTALQTTSPSSATTLYPDDYALIVVTFSAAVTTKCSPVLVMSARYFREAEYVSGNNTDTYTFKYTVKMGDYSSVLQYRHTPNALCSVSGCPYRTACAMLANSTNPSLPVNLKLYRPTDAVNLLGGVTLDASISVSPTTSARNTSISSIEIVEDAGEYGAGSALHFEVTFEDAVILSNTSAAALPRLFLNIGAYATYAGGNRGSVLVFRYITNATNVLTGSDLLPALISSTDSAIDCDASTGCDIKNQAGQDVDLHSPSSVFVASGVTLDPTPPIVTNVYSDKETSPYTESQYSTGERIRIIVEVSKPVVITGFYPRIEMNVSQPERFALYNESLSNTTRLVFVYEVKSGDYTADLMYKYPFIDLLDDNCRIYRESSIPTTQMDVTLPTPFALGSSASNTIRVDASDYPRVVAVTSVQSSRLVETAGVMYAGDSAVIRVEFDREVIAVGVSFLTLNLGHHVRPAVYIGYRDDLLAVSANYSAERAYNNFSAAYPNSVTNATRYLYYMYSVEEGDISSDLDYVDVFSLQTGITANNDPGYIAHASSEGQLPANLDLPQPGTPGSLRSDGIVIRVDGRRPYITALWYINPPGTYSTNATILIGMNFSAPVLVKGVPSIKMETGLVDNKAFYSSGSGTNMLIFAYTPEPGDFSTDLDYHADRSRFSSARGSFLLNGGSILAMSSDPFLPADIWLNPPHGSLRGDHTENVVTGTARFKDLYIDWRGPDYQLRFSSNVPESDTVLTVTQEPLDVSFSAERQLRPADAIANHRVGHAVDIEGDIAVVGCPNCNNSVTTIMAVVTSAEDGIIQREVQLLQTAVTAQPAKQSFHTSASVGGKVGGGFRLKHGLSGLTTLIPANADFSTMQSIIAFDIPSLGNVSVLREPYIYCACDNAFTWTLVFNDITTGPFAPLTLDGSELTGTNAQIMGPTIIQSPALLGGTFTLSAVGLTTSPVPYDANVARIKSAFAELGIPVYDVFISPTDVTRARSWSITFDAYLDSYEMPDITLDGTGLTGGETSIFMQVTRPGRHGPFGISGYFALSWRGNTTAWLRPNTTAAAMKAALEALPVINYVNVNRSSVPVMYGYTWTIEFVSVNLNSPRGLVLQDTSNLEPLIPVNQLIATEPVIEVQARYALGSRNQITGIARQGTFGWGAGAVHIYQRRNETWDELATIRGNDTVENNFFGGAVALFGDVLLVGAVGGNMNGRPEKQSIFCSATNGTFKIKFRGWTTDSISYNVTRAELLKAIISDNRVFDKLYTVSALDIDDWGGGSLCDNNTAVLTFYSPVDGAELLLGSDTGANLELLKFEKNFGYNAGVIEAAEVQAGTWRLHNNNSDPQQIGSAYIFRASYGCDSSSELCKKTNWSQEAQLFPVTSRVGSRFGTAVALSATIAVIGAPGTYNERGAVYVYEYSATTGRWNFLQIMTYPLVVEGENFGTSVAISANTIVVSAANYQGGIGGVFVFRRPSTGGAFIAAQALVPSTTLYTLSVGDNFGSGISIEGNLVAVGAPGHSDRSVYFGDQPAASARTKSGAVFLFERVSPAFNFKFLQRLNPSAVQEFDGFGHSVDINGKNLVVSAVQNSTGTLYPNKPIVEVMTSASYSGPKLGGTFKLRWLAQSDLSERRTQFLLHDISADALRRILERDLRTGPLLVTRSRVDVYDGGYAWSITFMDYDVQVPLFQADTSSLTGTNATVSVRYINESPSPLRSKVHVFQKPDIAYGFFREQLLLSPHVHQTADRCGQSARISGKYVIVGCPNRDLRIPSQNSGAAFMYHLGLLAVQWADNFTVLEGNTAPIEVVHNSVNIADIDEDILFHTETIDRNAFAEKQRFIQNLFGIPGPTKTYPDSMLDRTLLAGKATARTQFYGSTHNESRWVDGMYDYRAISDYVPIDTPHVLLREAQGVSDEIVTTSDSITETPDEFVVLGITTPGVWPSVFGKLYGQLRIFDPADGNIWAEPRYRKIYDTTSIETEGISRVSTAASVFSSSSSSVSKAEAGSVYGRSIAYCESLRVMAVGVPLATVSGRTAAGKVVLYHQDSAGNWTQDPTYITSPLPGLGGTRFGDSVALSRIYERNMSILAIGEPTVNKIYVYVSDGDSVGESYSLDLTLTWNDEEDSSDFTISQRFGERGTISLDGFLLVVAAPALESARVYRRIYDSFTGNWTWSGPTLLRSSDYDYDVIQGAKYLHRQDFGQSVAVSSRTILIGAPFADYDNLGRRDKFGTNLVETQWDTEGTSILSFARGRAYVFYSAPPSQAVFIRSPARLYYGEFSLSYAHKGIEETTTPLRFDSSAAEVSAALLALNNVDDIQVVYAPTEDDEGFLYSWSITFVDDWQDQVGNLSVYYRDNGCFNCTIFSAIFDNTSDVRNISVWSEVLSAQTPLEQVQILSADDRRNGDRFGAAVSVDGDQIVIGAPFSATMTTTSWDFEAGTLLGWHRTGDAFNYQPTFGDNAYLRGGQKSRQGSARLRATTNSVGMEGLYFIGTFEKRPGNPSNYRTSNPLFPEGEIQGEEPRGTLSSDVFIVRGNKISFMIGGGCDIYKVFVELIVDGLSVGKHTGKCAEKMQPVSFDTSQFISRAAQIRIVDNSSVSWGHINVDSFQFDWDVAGATIPNTNKKVSAGGVTETPLSGAAYLFHRVDSESLSENCGSADKSSCVWIQEVKLAASDKREDMQFGASVAVNNRAGVVLVGAPNAPFTGFYKEVPSVFPYINASDASTVAGLRFPVDSANMLLFQSNPRAVPERSGASGVWTLENQDYYNHADPRPSERAGAVYAYVKQHQKLFSDGRVAEAQSWGRSEHSKLQPPGISARDSFGSSIAYDGMSVAVSAPGQDGLLFDAGAAYVYSTEFSALSFSATEYPILENRLDRTVTLTMLRDLNVYAGAMVVEFATSDLTAQGVDDAKYEECLRIPAERRAAAGCGDYLLTAGVVEFPAGATTAGFTVSIVDDLCRERFMEYIQVTISVPGSAALQGERLSAKIRIDDNDYQRGSEFC